MSANDAGNRADRLGGLRRFAVAITVLNILGHAFFGFEQSFAQPVVALASAYSVELLLELIDARCNRRPLRFLGGGVRRFVEFLLSAHITGLRAPCSFTQTRDLDQSSSHPSSRSVRKLFCVYRTAAVHATSSTLQTSVSR